MGASTTIRARVAPALAGAARVGLGALWLAEGIAKYRAGFGAADIRLVVDSATSNPRVPGFFQQFAETALGNSAAAFGTLMPLLETLAGVALIAGVLTLPAACASVALLMTYWLADQLVGEYPVMVLLASSVLLFPAAAARWSVRGLLERGARRRTRRSALFDGPWSRWL